LAEFRFSPRTNRANDIGWMEWGEAAFSKARQEDRPVLLSVSAVWCHWCHVMDETSYSEPSVIALINSLYVPVRVDNDQRPDINLRYNMGGWPTTAFLTPEGEILAGGTYIPPEEFKRLLQTVSTVFHTRKVDIAAAVLEARQRQLRAQVPPPSGQLGSAIVGEVVDLLVQDFDREHGGFGDAPKFPEIDGLLLLLFYYRLTGEVRYLDMVTQTLRAMANGGVFDQVEGGFFRYSTTADWSVPHYEKMLDDNVWLLSLCLSVYRLTGERWLAETAEKVMGYMASTLYQRETGVLGGSQDADEAYYALSGEGRSGRQAPAVDPVAYTPWNAGAAVAFLDAWHVLGRPQARQIALRALRFLWSKCRDRDQGMYHYFADGQAKVSGLLSDNVAVARAWLAAYEDSGSVAYLRRAQQLAAIMERDFAAPTGGFYDRREDPNAQGQLGRRLMVLEENAAAAEVLDRLSVWTDMSHYKDLAEGALKALSSKYRSHGRLAAAYALAVAQHTYPAVTVKVSRVDTDRGRALYRAGLALRHPNTLVRALAPVEGGGPSPSALVCLGDRCLSPVREPVDLESALNEVAAVAS